MKSLVRFTLAVTTAVALATTFALAQSDQAYGHRRAQTHAGAQGQPLTGPSNASPVAIIAQYLRGLGRNVDVQSLVRESAGQGNSGTIRVEQRVGGVRVYGAYAKATLSGRGELVHLIENLVATPGAVSRARVSEADALAATLRTSIPTMRSRPGRDAVRATRSASSARRSSTRIRRSHASSILPRTARSAPALSSRRGPRRKIFSTKR